MAQTQLRTRLAQVAVKLETTQDQYIAPVLGDVFLAQDVEVTDESQNIEQNAVRNDGLTMADSPGLVVRRISFAVRLKGSGNAGTTDVEYGVALKACGLEVTNSAGVSDTYTPLLQFDGVGGNPGISYTVAVLEAGKLYAASGCFGNVVFTADAGDVGMARFTFTGAYVAEADTTMLVPVYQTTTAPTFLSASLAIGGSMGAYIPKGVRTFSLDVGNVVEPVTDPNNASGIYGSRIVSRRSFITFEPEDVLVATNDYYADWRAGTTGTFTTGVIGATENAWAITVNQMQYRPPEKIDRNGIRALTMAASITSPTTDVEGTNIDWQLQFT